MSLLLPSIKVLWSNADNVLPSDSRDGFLQLTLNVSGANGAPSDDDLAYSLFDSNKTTLSDQTTATPNGEELKQLAIS